MESLFSEGFYSIYFAGVVLLFISINYPLKYLSAKKIMALYLPLGGMRPYFEHDFIGITHLADKN
jgi:hypothetical protein